MAAETDAERIERERHETEAIGAEWANRSDEYLVGYMFQLRASRSAVLEMQRRQTIALRQFSTESTRQANIMIRLTRWIIGLTVALGLIAILQLVAMLWPRKGGV